MELSIAIGLFHILVGLMLVSAILLMGAGTVLWIIRLGTFPTYRDEAIEYMKLSVATLFVLIVLLSVAELVQAHVQAVIFGLGALLALALLFFILYTAANSGAKSHGKEEK
jgi:hypothetical protein